MFHRRLLPIVVLLTLAPVDGAAATPAGAPLPVSPGAVGSAVPVASACPTFSWGLLPGASRYEIEIAPAAGERSGAAEPGTAQTIELPGSASSWTPHGVACFPPGRPHAWRIRAATLDGWGAWSEPRLFIAPAATAVDEDRGGAAGTAGDEPASVGEAWGPREPPAGTPRVGAGRSSIAPKAATAPGQTGLRVLYEADPALDRVSAGIYTEASYADPDAVDAVYGVFATVPPISTGFRRVGVYGEADLGVLGEGLTGIEGFGTYTGGYFSATLGPGLFAASVVESEADIVMGGDNALLRAGDTDGDLILESGDDVIVGLGNDSQGSDSNFVIRERGSTANLFHVSEDGNVYVGGSMVHSSDRTTKSDLRPVDTGEILRRVVELPVQRWRWKDRPEGEEHLGPMAQDFHAAFGLGTDPRGIATVDADGVALAAIQELARLVAAQREELERQGAELERLRRRLEDERDR